MRVLPCQEKLNGLECTVYLEFWKMSSVLTETYKIHKGHDKRMVRVFTLKKRVSQARGRSFKIRSWSFKSKVCRVVFSQRLMDPRSYLPQCCGGYLHRKWIHCKDQGVETYEDGVGGWQMKIAVTLARPHFLRGVGIHVENGEAWGWEWMSLEGDAKGELWSAVDWVVTRRSQLSVQMTEVTTRTF